MLLLLAALVSPAGAQAPLTLVDKKTTVRDISFKFVDSQTFETSLLKQQIATSEPDFWDRVRRVLPLLSAKRYAFSPIELQKDAIRLERFYERNGFLHPRIDYLASQLDTTNNTIRVIFTVEEGPPLIIQDVGFFSPEGEYAANEFGPELRDDWIAFRDRITLQVGTRYTQFQGVRIEDQVLTWMKNAGFAFARISTETDIDSAANTVDIRFILRPGPIAYVSAILFEGLESVPEEVVLRELPLRVGDRFSHKRMIEGQRNIFGLNLFRVALADVPEQSVDSTVVIRYRLGEAKPRSVTAETGYARDDGVTLQSNWQHRNFLGGARDLTVSALARTGFGGQPPATVQSISRSLNLTASLRQPYLFSNKLSALFSPFYRWEDNPRQTLSFQEAGFSTTLLYEIYAFRTVSVQYTFSRAFPMGRSATAPAPMPELAPTLERRAIFNRSIFSVSAILGKTDDFLSPRRGFIIRPFLEAAGRLIASGVEYYKASTEVVGYLPLTDVHNLSARVFAGRIWPFGSSENQLDPNVEFRFDRIRFYGGGSNDVRGWPINFLGPKFILRDTVQTPGGEVQFKNVRYEPIGGLSKIAANLELRMPFPLLSPQWRSAVFIDAGQVSPEHAFRLGDLQYGIGGGLRYQSPVGAIRLDLGFKVNPRLTDIHDPEDILQLRLGRISRDDLPGRFWRRLRLHLSIGQAF